MHAALLHLCERECVCTLTYVYHGRKLAELAGLAGLARGPRAAKRGAYNVLEIPKITRVTKLSRANECYLFLAKFQSSVPDLGLRTWYFREKKVSHTNMRPTLKSLDIPQSSAILASTCDSFELYICMDVLYK